ncbi:hypothetical protein GTR02_10495 [Kineococcus sp. R8]|uniref:hypothetical protein n=1 Tax=Kineococcus siccus TaxID=2696567 RepID=UPI0014121FDA|nr:hypothetical protein [Kineococcus siccus]NAZ82246.1 hypothetical protein [Kineococcus siccus]
MSTQTGTGDAKQRAQETAGTAKQQANEVAGTAKEQAGAVAQSAQEQAGAVIGEAKHQALGVLDEVRRQVDEQSSTQRDRLAAFLREAGQELSGMAGGSQGSGMATNLVRQAGDRASTWGDTLSRHEPAELLDQVRSFARRKPGTFLLGALAAGLLAGRVTRGATAASSRTSDTPMGSGTELEPLATAPTPAAYPGLATTTTAPVTTAATTSTAPTSVDVTGENLDEDLVPHHIRSDVPSMSASQVPGTRP